MPPSLRHSDSFSNNRLRGVKNSNFAVEKPANVVLNQAMNANIISDVLWMSHPSNTM